MYILVVTIKLIIGDIGLVLKTVQQLKLLTQAAKPTLFFILHHTQGSSFIIFVNPVL